MVIMKRDEQQQKLSNKTVVCVCIHFNTYIKRQKFFLIRSVCPTITTSLSLVRRLKSNQLVCWEFQFEHLQ